MSKNTREWSAEEIDFIKENYLRMTYTEIGRILKRKSNTVKNKAIRMGLRKKTTKTKKWTAEEESLLISYYPWKSTKELREILPERTEKSIEGKVERMKLKKSEERRMVYWTEEEVEIIKANYYKCDSEEFKRLLPHKEWSQIQQKASALNVRKYNETGNKRRTKRIWSSESEIKEYVESNGHVFLESYFNRSGSRHIKFLTENGTERIMELTVYLGHDGQLPLYKYYFEDVVAHFKNSDYKLLTKKSEYSSGETVLSLVCPKGHSWSCSFQRFTQGVRCRECYHETIGERSRLDIEQVKSRILEKEVELVNIIESKGTETVFSFICTKHRDVGVQETVFHRFSQLKYGCLYCGLEDRKRENHPMWKDGITELSIWARGRASVWVKDSVEECGGRCEITNSDTSIEVHHKYSFAKILRESMKNLNMDIKERIGEYSSEELDKIKGEVISNHYKRGLGVCLREDVHYLFHSLYSFNKFTESDYEEFKERCASGEFDEILKKGDNEMK